jgi:hypothetical protein
MHGPDVLTRPYYYCHDCQYGFSQLDQALELAQQRKQYDLQHKALRLLAEMPF